MIALDDKHAPRLAVLDDEARMRKALCRLLRTHDFEVETFAAGEELIAGVQRVDCLVLDLHMPGMSGFDVLREFLARDIKLPVIVITGHDEPQNPARARALGACAYLTKPLDEASLLAAISEATAPGGNSAGTRYGRRDA